MASSYDYDAWGEGKRGASSKVVTLDGIAIPLVDPQNFSEFWEEREARRKKEREARGAAQAAADEARQKSAYDNGEGGGDEGGTTNDIGEDDSAANPARGIGNVGVATNSQSKAPASFYTASQRQNQGAVAMYGEGSSQTIRSGRRSDRAMGRSRQRPQSAHRSRSSRNNMSSSSPRNTSGRRPQSAQPAQRRGLGRKRPSSARTKQRRSSSRKDMGRARWWSSS